MPIQLQNHRTSNAKLFSVSSNKQKLHTAASLQQAHKNNLKVSKQSSGSGLAMVTRMFSNPTNATANKPDEIPERNCRQRRHSMTNGSLHSNADQSPSPNKRDSTQSEGRARGGMRRLVSLDTSLMMPGMDRGVSPSPSLPKDSEASNSSRRRKQQKNGVRRSRSFGTPQPVVKSIAPPVPNSTATSRRSKAKRRGSNDSAHSAATAPNLERSESDHVPQSTRDTLRAKREQFRRKSMGSISNLHVPLPATPPTSALNMLDDMSEPSESGNISCDDSLLSGSS